MTPHLDSFPQTLILHGANDTTVPVDSPVRFAESLQRVVGTDRVDWQILPNVGHVDFVTHLMMTGGEGKSNDVILDWIERKWLL